MDHNSPSYSDNLAAVRKAFDEAHALDKARREALWESLSEDQRIDMFCAVMERVHKGEIEQKGSYRYVLYDIFKFSPAAYTQAQMAGFLDIHNCIYTPNEIRELLAKFAADRFNVTDQTEIDNHVDNFMWDMYA